MISIVMLCVYIGFSLLTYLMSMMQGWELIFTLMFAFPVWYYARRHNVLWNVLFLVQTLALTLRIGVCTVVAFKVGGITPPITMDITLIRQFSGVTAIVGWLVWLICTAVALLSTVKCKVRKHETIKSLEHDRDIIHATNLFSVTTVIVIIDMVVATQAYALNDYYKNTITFIVVVIAIAIAVYMAQVSTIRAKKEEIILKEKNRDDLEIIDLAEDESSGSVQ